MATEFFPFCPQCSTILDAPDLDEVSCSCCAFKCQFEELHVPAVVTRSAPRPKPQWLASIEDNDDAKEQEEAAKKHATIEEPCPKCAHPELYFYTMQLRSVDEGSTVFYECPSCQHTFSQNN